MPKKPNTTKIQLGDRVKDMYTGFEGTAVGKSKWLYGCSRILVEPTELFEGKVRESTWFDEQRVMLVSKQDLKFSEQNKATTGGPQRDPVR